VVNSIKLRAIISKKEPLVCMEYESGYPSRRVCDVAETELHTYVHTK